MQTEREELLQLCKISLFILAGMGSCRCLKSFTKGVCKKIFPLGKVGLLIAFVLVKQFHPLTVQNPNMYSKAILVLDQEEAVRESLRFVLGEEGYYCYSARYEAEALSILKSKSVGLIVIDSQVLGSSELIEILTEEYPDLKIIIMCSYAEIDVTQKALISGAHDFIVKPIDFEELIEKLNTLLPFTV